MYAQTLMMNALAGRNTVEGLIMKLVKVGRVSHTQFNMVVARDNGDKETWYYEKVGNAYVQVGKDSD